MTQKNLRATKRADTVIVSERKNAVYRSAATGRIYTEGARISAARALVAANKKRGVETDPSIVRLASRWKAS